MGASIIDGGRTVFTYDFKIDLGASNPAQQLWDKLTDILGNCKAQGDGTLERSLPAACDIMPWLTAESIQSLRGFGGGNDPPILRDFPADEEYECPPLVGAQLIWPYYRAVIAFTAKPYRLLSDESISLQTVDYYLDDDNGSVSASTATYANEYDRFLHWTYTPNPDILLADYGQLTFRTFDNATLPNNIPCMNKPRVVTPQAMVELIWVGVPESYLESSKSLLVKNIGRVNQVAFDAWDPGELLYIGVSVLRRYPPPVPEIEEGATGTAFGIEKLLDLKLQFIETIRTPPTDGTKPPVPTNRSWIAAGHNLQAWLKTKSYYYVSGADSTAARQLPIYLSAVFQTLFNDPDAGL